MEPRFVRANGLSFAYLEQGDGPLVLLVHGFPDTAYTWEQAMPAVAAAGFRAVAPFTRGYHPTAIPDDGAYDINTLAADVIALIDALGAPRAVIVGHDWGAAAAYRAAITSPEKVAQLITVAVPHPRAVKPTPAMIWKMRHFAALRTRRAADRLRRDNFAYVDKLVRRWSPAREVPGDETLPVKQAFAHPGVAEAACGYYRAQKASFARLFRQPIAVPTVAFAGTDDNFVKPARYQRAQRFFTGSYRVVAQPGGHFLHRDHPDVFARELIAALREPSVGH